MTSVAATRTGRGLRGFVRGVLRGVLLVAAVIVGLLAMHTLNLHGTASADAPAAMSISAPGSADAPHHAVEGGTPGDTQGDRTLSCVGCGTDDHSGMAMMCVLALLLVLLLLIPPRVLRAGTGTVLRTALPEIIVARLLSRAPSLHVLCISRT